MTRNEAAKILGITPKADENAIKKAFRKKALELHPDRNSKADARIRFIEVHEAYEYLLDLYFGRIKEGYSTTRTYSTTNKSKFRSENHKHRHYKDPYADMSREDFESRFERAQKAAEANLERESELIYQNALDEFQSTWRKPLSKVMSVVGIILALLFIIDYSMGLTEESISSSSVQIRRKIEDHKGFFTIEVRGHTYRLPEDLNPIFEETKANRNIIINGEIIKTPVNIPISGIKLSDLQFTVNRTHLFKDIVGISIISSKFHKRLQSEYSVYGSFPLIPFLLLLPFISFWFEKPKFNFVFFAINYNIYVFPILVFILLFHDGRLFRVFGL